MEPIRILNHQQMAMIDEAAQKILAKTGLKFESEDALQFLKDFGCEVDSNSYIAKIPTQISNAVIQKMRKDYLSENRPERVPMRFSHVRFRPALHQIHTDFTVSAGGFSCFIDDLSGQRRLGTHKDVLCSLNMINHLDHINYTGLPITDQSVPARQRPVKMAAELVKYTQKLGGIETFYKEDVQFLHAIAQVVADGKESLSSSSKLVGYAEIRSPLCFDRNMLDIFMEYIKRGMPQTVDTMPAGGTTAPITGAGILAVGAAETIGAMVLAYAMRDDAIVAMDINPSYTDMSSGIYKYSGADRCHLLMARIQLLSEYYGCPTGVHGGKTDGCFYDERTGVDKTSSMILPVLAGAVGIGTVGHLENALTFSPIQLVIDHEITRYIRHAICRPMIVNQETLAVDLIDSIQPGGNFIDSMHTATHFRNELFLSEYFRAASWAKARSESGEYNIFDKSLDYAQTIWKLPEQPVLSDHQLREIEKIVKTLEDISSHNSGRTVVELHIPAKPTIKTKATM